MLTNYQDGSWDAELPLSAQIVYEPALENSCLRTLDCAVESRHTCMIESGRFDGRIPRYPQFGTWAGLSGIRSIGV